MAKSPPKITRRARRTNVRDVPSSFVGRSSDFDGLLVAFRSGTRLVTLAGPGGMGKTRIALRFVDQVLRDYATRGGGGAWFCDLTDARDVAALATVTANVLGVPLARHTDEGLVSEIGHVLARRGRMLLVLDNFEQLVAEGAAVVERWLRAAPYLDVLVTSRVPLGLPGEMRWLLDALPADEAATLFAARAREVRPRLEVPEGVVSEIVAAVDGIPLAIELAASRVAVLSLEALRDRLRRPLALLVKPEREKRHASMRRTILDSVEMLEPGERAAFACCSIFREGFTLDAAEAVLGEDALGRVESLCRSSLLRTRETGRGAAEVRFGMFETIRELALELAANDPERRHAERRHARFYRDLARSTVGEPTAERLAPEQGNLLAAHAHALENADADMAVTLALGLDPLLAARGLMQPRLALLSGTLTLVGRAGSLVNGGDAAALRVVRGVARREAGDAEHAREDLEAGLALARTAGRRDIVAQALVRLGELVEVSGQTLAAHACFVDALEQLSGAPASRARTLLEAEAHLRAGHTYRREGALGRAESAVREATSRYRRMRDDEGLASALYEGAVVAMFQGERQLALARFNEGLALARKASLTMIGAALTTARGGLLQELARFEEALAHHAEAARVFRDLGMPYREMTALYYLATAYLDAGDPAEAGAILPYARERGSGVGAPRYEALILGAHAIALARLGDQAAAESLLTNAERAGAACETQPCLGATLAIHRLTLRLTPDRDDESLAEAARLVRAHPSDDSRFAERMLLAAARPDSRAPPAALIVYPGRGFRPPHAREPVDLSRRAPLRAIVELLAEHRRAAPGEVVSVDAILRAAWPGEKTSAEAALNRTYVAMATLRKLGLRGILVTEGGGYLLSPGVPVVRQ